MLFSTVPVLQPDIIHQKQCYKDVLQVLYSLELQIESRLKID